MKRTVLASALVVAFGVLALFLLRAVGPDGEAASTERASGPATVAEVGPAALAAPSQAMPARLEAASARHGDALPAEADDPAPAASDGSELVRGLLLDPQGCPIAGVAVGFSGESYERAHRTAGDGVFELPAVAPPARVVISSTDWVLVRHGVLESLPQTDEFVLVAARPGRLAGEVLDDEGEPVADVDLRLSVPIEGLAAVKRRLDSSDGLELRASSDSDGRFSFDGAPAGLNSVTITTRRYGYFEGEFRVDASDLAPVDDLRLVLEPVEGSQIVVWGGVLGPDGEVVSGATVWCAGQSTTIDEYGDYELRLAGALADVRLVATAENHQAALRDAFGAELAAAQALDQDRLGPIDLVLGPPELRIRGRVLDAHGEPWEGWRVSLLDGQVLDDEEYPPRLVERLGDVYPFHVATDGAGRFELRGLSDRSYRLCARDPRTLLAVSSEPIPAGTLDAVLRSPASPLHELLEGRVVNRDGEPVAGVEVAAGAFLGLEANGGGLWLSGARVRTGAEGRFAIADVPRHGAYLRVTGEGIVPQRFLDLPASPGEPVTIVVQVQQRFRYEFAGDGVVPDLARVVDSAGEFLHLSIVGATGARTGYHVEVSDGRTPVFAVGEDAAALVLYRDSAEVARRALAPSPDPTVVNVVN